MSNQHIEKLHQDLLEHIHQDDLARDEAQGDFSGATEGDR